MKVVKRAKGCGGEGEGEVVGGGVKVEWGEGVGGEEGKEKVLAATEGYWEVNRHTSCHRRVLGQLQGAGYT